VQVHLLEAVGSRDVARVDGDFDALVLGEVNAWRVVLEEFVDWAILTHVWRCVDVESGAWSVALRTIICSSILPKTVLLVCLCVVVVVVVVSVVVVMRVESFVMVVMSKPVVVVMCKSVMVVLHVLMVRVVLMLMLRGQSLRCSGCWCRSLLLLLLGLWKWALQSEHLIAGLACCGGGLSGCWGRNCWCLSWREWCGVDVLSDCGGHFFLSGFF